MVKGCERMSRGRCLGLEDFAERQSLSFCGDHPAVWAEESEWEMKVSSKTKNQEEIQNFKEEIHEI